MARIRERWPKTRIIIRGDSGFCVGYVLRLARNSRLVRAIGGQLREAQEAHCRAGKPAGGFRDFDYRTRKSWSRSRRVVGKAEHLSKGPNPRFVVTNLPPSRGGARHLY